MDVWIRDSQRWLNATYGGRAGYVPAPENGLTGWSTMYSLTRALQLELGITATSNTFGPGTSSAFQTQISVITSATASQRPNIIGILRTALWCKGYAGGYSNPPSTPSFTAWHDDLVVSVNQMRADLGLGAGPVNVKLMKGLLTMDAYKLVAGGSAKIRSIQQWLNGRYFTRTDYEVVPCDGFYTRQVQKGYMIGVQYAVGIAEGSATGNFGPGTKSGLQAYGNVGFGSANEPRGLVSLFQAGLIFNGYSGVPFSGTFEGVTQTEMRDFQSFAQLSQTSSANFTTWASLLVSTGDPDRWVTGVDTNREITAARAAILDGAGYRVVGRYINGTTKRFTWNEARTLQNAGLRWFPIYQEWNDEPIRFSVIQGRNQGLRIAARARALGLPPDTLVFLSVDYDPQATEIDSLIAPHFTAARAALDAASSWPVKLGVYGTRNVCATLAARGITEGSFVADMATGWSGNLGFNLPADWMYDQIKETTIGSGTSAFPIDRNAVSFSARSLNADELVPTPRVYNGSSPVSYDEQNWWTWAQLATIADWAEDGSNIARARQVLYEAYRHHYGRNALPVNRPDSDANKATDDIFSPPPGSEATREAFRQQYQTLFGIPADGVFGWAADGGTALGDIPHAAVVAATYLFLTPPPGPPHLGDFASWAGDLMGVWKNYEDARIAAGGTLPVYSFVRSRIGTMEGVADNTNRFSLPDLQADCAGHIIATDVYAGSSITEAVRALLEGINRDPGHHAKRFYQSRFGGSRANGIAIAKAAVTNFFATTTPISNLYEGARKPDADGPGAPSASARAKESDELAAAFIDAVIAAQSGWSARS